MDTNMHLRSNNPDVSTGLSGDLFIYEVSTDSLPEALLVLSDLASGWDERSETLLSITTSTGLGGPREPAWTLTAITEGGDY